MIRDATEEDIPALIEMGKRFGEVAGLPAPIDPESLAVTFRQLIEGGILLTDGATCAAGGMVYPAYFNHAHLTGQEFFWWVEPGHRGRGGALFDLLEAAAKAKGAQSWTMVALESSRPEMTGKLYERRGYRPTEHSYTIIF